MVARFVLEYVYFSYNASWNVPVQQWVITYTYTVLLSSLYHIDYQEETPSLKLIKHP